jgi:hypothetical protein
MAEVRTTAFGGVRNTSHMERLQARARRDNPVVDLSAAINVDLDNTGQLARRSGTTQQLAGAAHSLWADGDDCFFMEDINLRRLHPDLSSEILAQGLTRGLTVQYVKVNGRTYFSNGRQTGVIDGRVRSWGLPIPAVPQASVASGQLAAGTYTFALSHVRFDGQESGVGQGATIDLPANGGIEFSWTPPDDPTVTDVALYLSEPNGTQLYRATRLPANATGTTLTGVQGALPLQTQWLDAPPAAQCLTYTNGRIYLGVGSNVYASNALGYEYVDMRDFVSLDGTPVRFLIGMEGGVYAGTDTAIYFLGGNTLADFQLRIVTAAPAVPNSALIAEGMAVTGNAQLAGQPVCLFAAGDGIYLGLRDGTVSNLTTERYHFTAPDNAAAVFRRTVFLNQYLLTLG